MQVNVDQTVVKHGIIVIATLMIASANCAAYPYFTDPGTDTACDPHPPILIQGEAGFENPASGVRSGTGTEEDPYVIEGWCIHTASGWNVGMVGILVSDTASHVVIQENTISALLTVPETGLPTNSGAGIVMENVKNVAIRNNTLDANARGIDAFMSTNVKIVENSIRDSRSMAVNLDGVTDSVVQDNQIANNAQGMILRGGLVRTTNISIDENMFHGNKEVGLHLQGAPGNQIRANQFLRNGLEDPRDSCGGGIELDDGSDNNRVTNNTFRDNDCGLKLFRAGENVILGNEISSSRSDGVNLRNAHNSTIRENRFQGNGVGLKVEESRNVDATLNWWGCKDGPDHPDCDDVLGDAQYEPWLMSSDASSGDVNSSEEGELGAPGIFALVIASALMAWRRKVLTNTTGE